MLSFTEETVELVSLRTEQLHLIIVNSTPLHPHKSTGTSMPKNATLESAVNQNQTWFIWKAVLSERAANSCSRPTVRWVPGDADPPFPLSSHTVRSGSPPSPTRVQMAAGSDTVSLAWISSGKPSTQEKFKWVSPMGEGCGIPPQFWNNSGKESVSTEV